MKNRKLFVKFLFVLLLFFSLKIHSAYADWKCSTSSLITNNHTLCIESCFDCSGGRGTCISAPCYSYNPPINGHCGTANGGSFVTAPSSNLCSAGTESVVSAKVANWSWGCIGQYGGTSAACTAAIADNGCAAITCTPATANPPGSGTCWNGLAFVNGTKNCATTIDCAPNYCTNQTCFNGVSWVQGTKNCVENGSCGSNQAQYLDINNLPSSGWCNTGLYAGFSFAPLGSSLIWQCNGIGGGTSASCIAYTTNNCAANTCTNTTCFNGATNVQGTKAIIYTSPTCNYIDSVDCTQQANCGAINTRTALCLANDNCGNSGVSRPLSECGSSCVSTTNQCPACPSAAAPSSWREVNP